MGFDGDLLMVRCGTTSSIASKDRMRAFEEARTARQLLKPGFHLLTVGATFQTVMMNAIDTAPASSATPAAAIAARTCPRPSTGGWSWWASPAGHYPMETMPDFAAVLHGWLREMEAAA